MTNLESILDYGLRFVGTPYMWGGMAPDCGFDCSGLVSELLMAGGMLRERTTAEGIHALFSEESVAFPARGSLLFFGAPEKIVHVAVALSDKLMLEAAGGCHTTTTVAIADNAGAFVKVRPIASRRDLVNISMPRYD